MRLINYNIRRQQEWHVNTYIAHAQLTVYTNSKTNIPKRDLKAANVVRVLFEQCELMTKYQLN